MLLSRRSLAALAFGLFLLALVSPAAGEDAETSLCKGKYKGKGLTQAVLSRILKAHSKWLEEPKGRHGEKANLCEADLYRADLRKADLREANLQAAILSWANLEEAELTGSDLQNADLHGANLRDAKMGGSDLRRASLEQAKLQEANLVQAKLQGAVLVNANLQEADLTGAQLQKADLYQAQLQEAVLREANLENANLRRANLGWVLREESAQGPRSAMQEERSTEKSGLVESELQGADLTGANLRGADLSEANLQRALMVDADLQGATLERAKLQQAKLGEANLSNAKMSAAQLQGSDLFLANLQGAALDEANLQDAKLSYANLEKAVLDGANLHEADLRHAKLSGASLRGAKLGSANLEFADLSRADFTNANLRNAILTEATVSKVTLQLADMFGAILKEVDLDGVIFNLRPGGIPDIIALGTAKNLARITYDNNSPHTLVELRDGFRQLGMRTMERAITYAIERERQWQGPWFEGAIKYLMFDRTSEYGNSPTRPLLFLMFLTLFCSFIYYVALRRSREAKIVADWEDVSKEPEPVTPRFFFPNLHFRFSGGRGEKILDEFCMPLMAFYFSVLSTFHIGWRDLNVGSWLLRMQPREYTLRPKGWVRTVSALQSIVSVYLLALWVLTYFGRPFE